MTSPAFHTPFESLMRSADKRERGKGSEMEEMVCMNNNHQAQHVRHTQHTHTLRRGGVQRMLAGRIYYFTVSRARPLDSIEKEKKEKKNKEKATLPL